MNIYKFISLFVLFICLGMADIICQEGCECCDQITTSGLTKCVTCKPNYVFYNGICFMDAKKNPQMQATDPHCSIMNQTKCIWCDPGFHINNINRCEQKDVYCTKIDTNGECLSCSKSYQLNKDSICELKPNLQIQFDYQHQSEWQGSCGLGVRQSPVNIVFKDVQFCPKDNHFELHHDNKEAYDINPAGQNLKTSYTNQTFIKYQSSKVGQNEFASAQFHWHHPSEHLINDVRYDLELHIVHKNTNPEKNGYAVAGLLFKVDHHLQTDIFDEIDFIKGENDKNFRFLFDLDQVSAFHYDGSLTTPGCDEVVDWFVYMKIFTISEKNFQRMKEAINQGHDNSRAIQQLNGRSVQVIGGFCNNFILENLEVTPTNVSENHNPEVTPSGGAIVIETKNLQVDQGKN